MTYKAQDIPYSTETFRKAADDVETLVKAGKPSDAQKLAFYGLYKQHETGDNTTEAPSFYEFKGKAKHDAWSKNKGKSKEVAGQEYIALVEKAKAELDWDNLN